MKPKVSIEGLAALTAALEALPRDLRDEFKEVVARRSGNILAAARARVPRDEDDLFNSLDEVLTDDGLTAEIGSRGLSDPRAAATEWGTERMPAEPWLFPSFLEEAKPARKEMRDLVKAVPLKVRTRIRRDKRTR